MRLYPQRTNLVNFWIGCWLVPSISFDHLVTKTRVTSVAQIELCSFRTSAHFGTDKALELDIQRYVMTLHKLTLLDYKISSNWDEVMSKEFRMGSLEREGGCKGGYLNWKRTRFDLFSTIRIFSKCRCQQVKQIQTYFVLEGRGREYRFLFETVMKKIWV